MYLLVLKIDTKHSTKKIPTPASCTAVKVSASVKASCPPRVSVQLQDEASFRPPVSSSPQFFKPPVTKRHRKLLLKRSYSPSHSAPYARSATTLSQASQETRRKLLHDVCARYQPDASLYAFSQRQVSRVFIEDRHRLLYCEVPKSGCSNWKRVLMVLNGKARTTLDIPHDQAHYANDLRRLETYDRASIAKKLTTYTKICLSANLLSDLFRRSETSFENPNSYYHPVFGRPIISKYRANATRKALRTGAGVTFREFVRYLLDVKRPVGMDIHWEPVTQMCSPCLMRYNFIGKFENLEKEANFLLRNIDAPENLTFPDVKDRNPLAERTSAEITQRYFAQLDAAERQKVYDFYYMDYLMFDYPKPFKELH
ncbi:hypothetical protein WMY93_022968 [Mugilogobius chulae]|uniref:Carbohydrate sulfotransferase n=1 Tax=Mugilogobius chulae TaxID=88201 RepID=A0AAW0N7D7_9GOBI